MLIWETIRFVLIDFALNVVYFPVWWYTTGLLKVVQLINREAGGLIRSLNLRTLARFLFKPMFGQNDIVGRIISFYVRSVHFTVLTVYTVVYTIVMSLLLVVWILIPPMIAYMIAYNLGFINVDPLYTLTSFF